MVTPNEPMIARMAEIILKVEANIEALRDHERRAAVVIEASPRKVVAMLAEYRKRRDALHGWIAGGPDGAQLFATRDGGLTWQPQALELPPGAPPGRRAAPPRCGRGRAREFPRHAAE